MSEQIFRKFHAPIFKNMLGQKHVHSWTGYIQYTPPQTLFEPVFQGFF